MRGKIDPRICNIAVDANVYDTDGTTRDLLVARFRRLSQLGGPLSVVVSGGVREEARHPGTPGHVRDDVMGKIYNLRPAPNTEQRSVRRAVRAVLQGNAQPGKHAADASHLCEAAETGCAYFITEDKRVLAKRQKLEAYLRLTILTLREFMEVFDSYKNGRARADA